MIHLNEIWPWCLGHLELTLTILWIIMFPITYWYARRDVMRGSGKGLERTWNDIVFTTFVAILWPISWFFESLFLLHGYLKKRGSLKAPQWL